MEKGILEKTGKAVKEWVAIVRQKKLEKHGEIIKFLKAEHDFTHGYANYVAHKVRSSDASEFDGQELIDSQYSKGKEHLKPIYDKIIAIVQAFGEDVEIAPKKSSVSLRCKRQFALVKPATKSRIDLGLKFNDKPTGDRLQNSGPFGTMCTHRVVLTQESEVDEQLADWLQEAYEEAR